MKRTPEEFVKAMCYLLYEHEPETPEEVDASLRAEGLDPEEIAERGRALATRLLEGQVTVRGYHYGHPIRLDSDGQRWVFEETGESIHTAPVACARCGRMPTVEGHDPCLGHIPGAVAACCGHGVEPGYIMYEGGHVEVTPKAGPAPYEPTGFPPAAIGPTA